MSRHEKRLRAVMSEIDSSKDRSSLFWWLVEHHDEIADAARGRRLQWSGLCVRFAEAGLADRTGKTPTAATARKTWHRARRMVVRDRERQATAARRPKQVGSEAPSRMGRDWRPETVESGPAKRNPLDHIPMPAISNRVPAPVSASLNKPPPLPEWAKHLGDEEQEEENDDDLLPPDLPAEYPAEARANLVRLAKEQRAEDRKRFGLPPKRRTT